MSDLFKFIKNEKNTKGPEDKKKDNDINLAIYSHVGEYIEPNSSDYPANPPDRKNRREDIPFYDLDREAQEQQLIDLKKEIVKLSDELADINDKYNELNKKYNLNITEKVKYEYMFSEYKNLIIKVTKLLPYYEEIQFTGIGCPEEWKDMQLVEVFSQSINDILSKSKLLQEKVSGFKNNVTECDTEPVANDNKKSDISDIEVDVYGGFEEITDDTAEKYKNIIEDEGAKAIIKVIGDTGLSMTNDIKEEEDIKRVFITQTSTFNQSLFMQKFNILSDMMLLKKEPLNIKGKGGVGCVYNLTDAGIELYNYLYKKTPTESEKTKILKQHSSLEHGYFIKSVSSVFKEKGYKVYDEPEDCKVDILDGEGKNRRVEADLIIEKGENKYIIECEMGTTSDADMTLKMDKLVLASKVLSFITPNQESFIKTSVKIDKYVSKIGGAKCLQGYTIRLATFDMIKKFGETEEQENWNKKIFDKKEKN